MQRLLLVILAIVTIYIIECRSAPSSERSIELSTENVSEDQQNYSNNVGVEFTRRDRPREPFIDKFQNPYYQNKNYKDKPLELVADMFKLALRAFVTGALDEVRKLGKRMGGEENPVVHEMGDMVRIVFPQL